ncbi:HAD family hydrolase [Pararhodobacter oceanensis]|uniref:HAD family hydrolase n=1 Tax=Pararhodobacter oceanensis TaxID=2172121 RepID=UPI003A9271D1
MIEGIENIRAIAWDFNGVLNIAGDSWRAALRAELGIDPEAFEQAVFKRNRRALQIGEDDILDRLEAFVAESGFEGNAEDILEVLLEQDNAPDRELLLMIAQLDRAGVAQVMATNCDARRARFLAVEGGWAERFDAIFASGELGVAKPDAGFFQRIEEAMNLAPEELLLIDDRERNIDAADTRGWQVWHYQSGGAMALAQALMPLLLRAED